MACVPCVSSDADKWSPVAVVQDGDTALMAAVKTNSVNSVQALLERNDIDVNVQNKVGVCKWKGPLKVLDGLGTHDWCVAVWLQCAECRSARRMSGRDSECTDGSRGNGMQCA